MIGILLVISGIILVLVGLFVMFLGFIDFSGYFANVFEIFDIYLDDTLAYGLVIVIGMIITIVGMILVKLGISD